MINSRTEEKIPERLYRFMPSEGVIKTILNKNLRISDVSKLNDPYDMSLGVTDAPSDFLQMHYTKFNRAVKETISKQWGVISFCSHHHDPTLWAHYADNHKGMCLVFDTNAVEPENFQKVLYSKVKPSIPFDSLGSENLESQLLPITEQLLTTKSPSWSYESEYRLTPSMDIGDGSGFLRLPEGFLKEVILGLNCDYSEPNIKNMLQGAGYKGVAIRRAVLAPETYSLYAELKFILPHNSDQLPPDELSSIVYNHLDEIDIDDEERNHFKHIYSPDFLRANTVKVE